MIEFYVGKGGIAPTRKPEDAGFDFYIPEDWKPYGDEQTARFLKPGEGILINTKIRSKFNCNKALIAFNKSGVATKKYLQVGACVVDSGYQGEIHIHVFNWSNDCEVVLRAGDKLVQFVLIDIDVLDQENHYEDDVTVEEFYGQISERGEGGFGSTGDKA